jgi:branched-chain amino acid transport system permease protein
VQIVINSLIAAAVYASVALSFGIIYVPTRFFHFAHGMVFTFGAYFAYLFKSVLGLPVCVAYPLAILLSTVIGCLTEVCVYRRLRRKNASALILLLASLGIYIVFQNTLSLFFGDDIKSIRAVDVRQGISFAGSRITPIQIVTIIASGCLLALTSLWIKTSRMGKAMRAVASDWELARTTGIDIDRVILCAFSIGSAIAGIAGILAALDVDMTPGMGLNALMMGVIVVIIGGVGSMEGIALSALVLGLAQNFGVWRISTQWQDCVAFGVLLAFLIFRPEGILGKQNKKATLQIE